MLCKNFRAEKFPETTLQNRRPSEETRILEQKIFTCVALAAPNAAWRQCLAKIFVPKTLRKKPCKTQVPMKTVSCGCRFLAQGKGAKQPVQASRSAQSEPPTKKPIHVQTPDSGQLQTRVGPDLRHPTSFNFSQMQEVQQEKM